MVVIKSFADFINEAKVTVKRKYTEQHPANIVSDYAPVRERILSFVKENGRVSKHQILEFLKGLNEDRHRTASFHWVSRNESYFNVKESGGVTYYTLSSLGERVHTKIVTAAK